MMGDAWIFSVESWRKRLGRIANGGSLNVSDICGVSGIEQDVKFALLVANAYRRYCELPYVIDCTDRHSAASNDTVRAESWFSDLQSALVRDSHEFVRSVDFPPGFHLVSESARSLTSRKKKKRDGDLVKAEHVLDKLKNMTSGLPSEFSDMPLRGTFISKAVI